MLASQTLRAPIFSTLALAAAVIAPFAGAARAEQAMVPPGATASGRWVGAESRTPLAGAEASPQQGFRLRSGATGGDGQPR